MDSLERYLEDHGGVENPRLIAEGETVGGWRIRALIGRGGSSEVYRVERVSGEGEAAMKVLLPAGDGGDAHRIGRFKREIEILSSGACAHLPRFKGSGEWRGLPYLVEELLEARELPHADRTCADYMLRVCAALGEIHAMGLVHRDLKPGNILFRPGGELVIADLGLVKSIERAETSSEASVVDGRRLGGGTPGYAAPEQFLGGEISVSSDIHALGVLIDRCFAGQPPGPWRDIAEKATSSLPALRYASAGELATAIRRRHLRRKAAFFSLFAAVLAVASAAAAYWWESAGRDWFVWRSISERMQTNVAAKVILDVKYMDVTNQFGDVVAHLPGKVRYTNAVHRIEVTVVRLNGEKRVFKTPVRLEPGREYWIEGPGILDAELKAAEGGNAVRMKDCIFINRSREHPDKSGLRLELSDDARMKMPNFGEGL